MTNKRRAYRKAYYRKNRKKIAKQNAAHYRKNRKKIAAYRRKNRKKIAKRMAAYHRKNRKAIVKRKAAHYRKNRKRFAKRGAAYRRKNHKAIVKQMAAYYRKNRKKIAKQRAAYYRKNCRTMAGRYGAMMQRHKRQLAPRGIKGQPMSLKSYRKKLYFADSRERSCWYCLGENNKTGGGLDRLDNNITYTVENTVPCCRGCNVWRADNYTVQETRDHFKPMRDAAKKKLLDSLKI